MGKVKKESSKCCHFQTAWVSVSVSLVIFLFGLHSGWCWMLVDFSWVRSPFFLEKLGHSSSHLSINTNINYIPTPKKSIETAGCPLYTDKLVELAVNVSVDVVHWLRFVLDEFLNEFCVQFFTHSSVVQLSFFGKQSSVSIFVAVLALLCEPSVYEIN